LWALRRAVCSLIASGCVALCNWHFIPFAHQLISLPPTQQGTLGRYGVPRTTILALIFTIPGVVCGLVGITATSPALCFVFAGLSLMFFVAIFSPIVGVILAVVTRLFCYVLPCSFCAR
jgi:hypothetical protein